MRLRNLIWKELWERPTAMLTSLLAILLGVTAFVAIRSVGVSSEQAVSKELQALGANVLMLPKGVTLQDYYGADQHGETIPEEHALRLALANLVGVEHVSPKLCVPAALQGRDVTLTGILPQSEFQAKAAWGGAELFSNKHSGCKRACARSAGAAPDSMATRRVVQELQENEALLGADVAQFAKVAKGGQIEILGESLKVVAILPATGTVDDGRVFAHLHTVQRLAKAGEVVNAIEIMGCCEDAAGSLVNELRTMFPDTKIVTISQVVETQVSVNRTMHRVSGLMFVVLIVLGGASMAGAMYSNVSERRREVGTLMALGATPGFIARLFLGKASLLGLAGGFGGAMVGTGLAMVLGPQLAGVSVEPLPWLGLVAVATSLAVAVAASYLPARRAAHIDPCLAFKEI